MQTHLQLVHDRWLSGFFNFDIFNLNISNPESFGRNQLFQAFEAVSTREQVFIYTKVPVTALNCIHGLEDSGFRMIDTNIVFQRRIRKKKSVSSNTDIRFSRMEDKEGIGHLAGKNFKYSRFHLDPVIEDRVANTIKAQWAMNYFTGDRGDNMIVSEKDGRIRGFLQLLYSDDVLVIDLIAVSKEYRNKNIASQMINFAERSLDGFEHIRVGTQAANIPSVRLYEKLGFRMNDVKYLLHYHGR